MPFFKRIAEPPVEAWQFPGDDRGVCRGECVAEVIHSARGSTNDPHVHTAHHQIVFLEEGDWIMAEPDGRGGYYPIKPNIFDARYEEVKP